MLRRPIAPAHEALDEFKRKLAAAVASQCTAKQIRARSLANLHRWRSNGVWVSAYDEWKEILDAVTRSMCRVAGRRFDGA